MSDVIFGYRRSRSGVRLIWRRCQPASQHWRTRRLARNLWI